MASPLTMLLPCIASPEPAAEDFFGQVPDRASKLPGKAPALAILLASLRRGQDREYRVPGDADLAMELGCSESTIRRAWRDLETASVFARGDRFRSQGKHWRLVQVLFVKRGEAARARTSKYASPVARTNAQPALTSARPPQVLSSRASDSERKTDTVSSPSGGERPACEPETGRVASLPFPEPELELIATPALDVVIIPAVPAEAFVEVDLAEVTTPLAHLTDAELDAIVKTRGKTPQGIHARIEIGRRREMAAQASAQKQPETKPQPHPRPAPRPAPVRSEAPAVTPSAPTAFTPAIGPKAQTERPRHVPRDGTVRLGTLLELVAQLRAAPPPAKGQLVSRLVDLACTRWRDHKVQTRAHFRAAFEGLPPELLVDLVGDCDSTGKDPARLFSHRTGKALQAQRQAQEARS